MGDAFLIGNGQITRLQGVIGETPPCPEAKFKPRDVVKIRRLKHLRHLPEIAVVVCVVPPGFSPDWAWADLHKRPRPLMHQVPARQIKYFVGMENGETMLIREQWLKATGEVGNFSWSPP
jgi:hypothetical protein